ncbi:MAG TPA: type II 3-dehydroquinate dehydratase [Gemmatimonadales bacterium]|nr:type II 3-dehydroquinate dehydratase [Gemmatimonadales bacterium]
MRIAVLNGPNLDLLGVREPEVYGRATLSEIEALVRAEAQGLGVEVEWFQSNHEGAFVEQVHALRGRADGVVVNAAAWTHGNLAVRDALLGVGIPYVEVHLSNLFAREPERRGSVLADRAVGFICGFGPAGYVLALRALVDRLRER